MVVTGEPPTAALHLVMARGNGEWTEVHRAAFNRAMIEAGYRGEVRWDGYREINGVWSHVERTSLLTE
jgi:hypothetical protein